MEFKKIELEIDYVKAGLEDSQKPYLECFIPGPDLYQEINEDRKNQTVLVLPGGGYGMTSAREHDPIVFQFLAAGFTVFALKYSVKPNIFPRALFEAFSAIKMIRKYADKWHVDVNKIAVCGFSAGGHLTASTGAFWNEEFVKKALNVTDEHKPNALVLCYPVITAGKYAHKGSFKNLTGKDEISEEDIKYFSIENRISDSFPPSFVWHTATDNAVPVMNSLILCEELSKNNITFELHIYPKGCHGLALSNKVASKLTSETPVKPRAWVKDSIDFLNDIAYND